MPTFAHKRMAGAWVIMQLRNLILMSAPKWWGWVGGADQGPVLTCPYSCHCAFLLMWKTIPCTSITSQDSIDVWVCAMSLQSCLALCDTMDCSPPGSSVHGIFRARILEWGAIAFSGLNTRRLILTGGCFPDFVWAKLENMHISKAKWIMES